jgi:glycerophosphoryl diester phosphodiesterase
MPAVMPVAGASTGPGGRTTAVAIVAHRGAVDGGERDRVAGLHECLAAGVRCAEIDVRLHRGEPVLAHDRPRRGAVPDPLSDALALAPVFDWLMLDIKEAAAAIPAASAVAAGACPGGPGGDVRFCSTAGADLVAVRSVLPDARVSLSFPDAGRSGLRTAWRAPAGWLYPLWRILLPVLVLWWWVRLDPDMLTLDHRVVTRPGLRVARALGIPVVAWTVNDPQEARWLGRAGVAGITTDRPLALGAGTGRGDDGEGAEAVRGRSREAGAPAPPR